MRRLLFALLFVCIACGGATAQTLFAPPGAEWYHAMHYGTFYSHYTKDTVVAGTPCREVVQNAYTDSRWLLLGLHISDHSSLYVYNNADTVFVYNHLFSKFTPLYVFNVNQGDTVTLPQLPPEPGYLPTLTDSFFSFIVDSVKIVTYDTAHLKTIYTSTIAEARPSVFFTYGNDSTHGYAERIGTVAGAIMPVCSGCMWPLTESLQLQDSLRCYSHPGFSVRLTSGICGRDQTSVAEATASSDVKAFPNPAYDVLSVEVPSHFGASAIALYSGTGYQVFSAQQKGNFSIPTSHLAPGVYYLRVLPEAGQPIVKMISVLR